MYVNAVRIVDSNSNRSSGTMRTVVCSSVTLQDLSPTGQKFYPTGIGFLQQRYHLSPSSHQPIPVRQHSLPRLRMKIQTLFHSFQFIYHYHCLFCTRSHHTVPPRALHLPPEPTTTTTNDKLYILHLYECYMCVFYGHVPRTVRFINSRACKAKPRPSFAFHPIFYFIHFFFFSYFFLHLLWPPLFF